MSSDDNNARRRWMGILAKARPEEVAECWSKIEPPPPYDLLRRPETGLVMVRGRVGGDGAPFNLGEMTVTRCSVRLANGIVGHAWIAGRAAAQAERAALIDALLQSPGGRADIEALLDQLAARRETRKREAARKAAATRVDFFTMARGED
ncbi:phosphonate C-P lyase system protein PhnG [Telmatospirillum siberiense]|uniref:Phosphonate C-P lyase system protein PhnG n=1 Tax=Telmatospirillum siberiense TaxID=382514 RepID=A0A2N3Q159_9PROT|nr:phosphonate C-P lyase system protein PhnG [Telmatospirillum siberiense]PKU26400.1 phosphonate C-P lyase system protein PhnG [Telmatospirillum siberiense]